MCNVPKGLQQQARIVVLRCGGYLTLLDSNATASQLDTECFCAACVYCLQTSHMLPRQFCHTRNIMLQSQNAETRKLQGDWFNRQFCSSGVV